MDTYFFPIAGTCSRKRFTSTWFMRRSRFASVMKSIGFYIADEVSDEKELGVWDGKLDGTVFNGDLLGFSDHETWEEGGEYCYHLLKNRIKAALRKPDYSEADNIVFIAHSHGGQVAMYMLSRLAKSGFSDQDRVNIYLVTVDTPNRKDMEQYQIQTAKVVKGWYHFHSSWTWASRMRWLGARQVFTPWRRMKMPHADVNSKIRDHGCVLIYPHLFRKRWEDVAKFVRARSEVGSVDS